MKKSKIILFLVIFILLGFTILIVGIINNSKPTSIPIDSNTNLIISPNKQYKAFTNNDANSLQIVDLLNNKIVYELKNKTDFNNETNDEKNASFSPQKWSPDSNSLIYERFGREMYYIEIVSKINGEFTNSVTELNKSPYYTNCASGIWSPDSKKLVTVGENRSRCISSIYTIDYNKGITVKSIDGKNFKDTSTSSDSIEDAVWSIDSKSVTLFKNTLEEEYGRAVLKSEKIIIQVE